MKYCGFQSKFTKIPYNYKIRELIDQYNRKEVDLMKLIKEDKVPFEEFNYVLVTYIKSFLISEKTNMWSIILVVKANISSVYNTNFYFLILVDYKINMIIIAKLNVILLKAYNGNVRYDSSNN
jgi:hypothetical protein